MKRNCLLKSQYLNNIKFNKILWNLFHSIKYKVKYLAVGKTFSVSRSWKAKPSEGKSSISKQSPISCFTG